MKEDRLLFQYRKEIIPAILRLFLPEKVLFFGSRVKGTATKDSDIDVIIVSESFAGIPFIRRAALVMKSARFLKTCGLSLLHPKRICAIEKNFQYPPGCGRDGR